MLPIALKYAARQLARDLICNDIDSTSRIQHPTDWCRHLLCKAATNLLTNHVARCCRAVEILRKLTAPNAHIKNNLPEVS